MIRSILSLVSTVQRSPLTKSTKLTAGKYISTLQSRTLNTSNVLYKKGKDSKRKQTQSDDEDDDKDIPADALVDKNSKIMDVKVMSLRLDGIIKAGLHMARNKIELNFYENKIRVNGEKVLKKSESVREGDEIDVIKGPSPTNPNLLTVARVEILKVTPDEEFIALRLRRSKTLLIEPYDN